MRTRTPTREERQRQTAEREQARADRLAARIADRALIVAGKFVKFHPRPQFERLAAERTFRVAPLGTTRQDGDEIVFYETDTHAPRQSGKNRKRARQRIAQRSFADRDTFAPGSQAVHAARRAMAAR